MYVIRPLQLAPFSILALSTHRDIIRSGGLDRGQNSELCAESWDHLRATKQVILAALVHTLLADQVGYLVDGLPIQCHCLCREDHVHLVLQLSLPARKLCHLRHLLGHLLAHSDQRVVLFQELVCQLPQHVSCQLGREGEGGGGGGELSGELGDMARDHLPAGKGEGGERTVRGAGRRRLMHMGNLSTKTALRDNLPIQDKMTGLNAAFITSPIMKSVITRQTNGSKQQAQILKSREIHMPSYCHLNDLMDLGLLC